MLASRVVIGLAIAAAFVLSVSRSVAAETLEDAFAIALAVNQDYEAGKWTRSANQRELQAAQAERWPTVNLGGAYALTNPTMPLIFTQGEGFFGAAAARMPLYTSGRIDGRIHAASSQLAGAGHELHRKALDLRWSVAEAYVEVLRSQRALVVAQCNIKALAAHLHDARMLFEQGMAPRTDMLAASVALANAHRREIEVQRRLDAARAVYNRYLGRDLASTVQIEELPLLPIEQPLEALTSLAIERRPELAQLAHEANSYRHQASSLLGTVRPQVFAMGQYFYLQNLPQAQDGISSASIAVEWQPFDGGQTAHQAASLRQKAEASLRQRMDHRESIALEVRDAWLEVQASRRQYELTNAAIEHAEENLRLASESYKAGMDTSTRVLDAESLRAESYFNHFDSLYNSQRAALRLRRGIGSL